MFRMHPILKVPLYNNTDIPKSEKYLKLKTEFISSISDKEEITCIDFFSLKILEKETLKNTIWLVYCCVQGTDVNRVLNSTSNSRPSHYPLLSALDHTPGQ